MTNEELIAFLHMTCSVLRTFSKGGRNLCEDGPYFVIWQFPAKDPWLDIKLDCGAFYISPTDSRVWGEGMSVTVAEHVIKMAMENGP